MPGPVLPGYPPPLCPAVPADIQGFTRIHPAQQARPLSATIPSSRPFAFVTLHQTADGCCLPDAARQTDGFLQDFKLPVTNGPFRQDRFHHERVASMSSGSLFRSTEVVLRNSCSHPSPHQCPTGWWRPGPVDRHASDTIGVHQQPGSSVMPPACRAAPFAVIVAPPDALYRMTCNRSPRQRSSLTGWPGTAVVVVRAHLTLRWLTTATLTPAFRL